MTRITNTRYVVAIEKHVTSNTGHTKSLQYNAHAKEPVRQRDDALRLPKPIYEALPFFLVAVGVVFIMLALRRYEYAPTLVILLLGIFCVFAGILLLAIRIVYRIRSSAEEAD